MKTILVVDDDHQARSMYSLALTRNGYHVLEADSGLAGLRMAQQHLPDLVLSDINMPGGTGSTLLRDIRHDPELKSVQVVLMTGRPDLIAPRKGMEDGADDFLVKPVALKTLMNCVEARFSRASINWRVEDKMLAELRSSVPPNLPHEFFTPLAGIIGLVEILRTDFKNLAPKEVEDIHADIHQSALRLHRTLRNYLLILDLQTALIEPPPPLSYEEVQQAIQKGLIEALRQNTRGDDIRIEAKARSVSMRAEDLCRVVEELVDNACKYSRHGTPVEVILGERGKLTVRDEGRGMTEEQIGSIGFFQQFDRKKHEQQGLGLGLVLVQKLSSLYGAKVLIHSTPGEGTSVEIDFPTLSVAQEIPPKSLDSGVGWARHLS